MNNLLGNSSTKELEMLKLLFHGTYKTDPVLIYNSEDGLDIRFSKEGYYGQGIYFAEDPAYSDVYGYVIPNPNTSKETPIP